MTVFVAVSPNRVTRKNAQENVTQVAGAIRRGQNVLKAVVVVPREEELFVSTPKMMSWMIANAHIRRKLSFRDAMSSLVPIGNQGTGQSAWSPVEKDRSTARSGVSSAKID